jgi:hypothetical protein
MTNILAIIDKIIEEHKIILADFQSLEKVVNDAGALLAMEMSREAFMPGRLSPREGLQKLDQMRDKVTTGLEAHFIREETALLEALQEYGHADLIAALKNLLNAHLEIRSELDILKDQVGELLPEKLSRSLWESKGYDIRARINQLHKTMAAHAADEQLLLHKVQQVIQNQKS